MFTQYLQSIEFVTLYPIVALLLFLSVFIGAVVWALRADQEYISRMEELPLDSTADR
jgi:hypothetical protein